MSDITNITIPPGKAEADIAVDQKVDALIQTVGKRVRRAREMKGLPRRVVSERSGVSPRYLAQLEAGEGNISIGLLKRVAVALDFPVDWFISEDDPWTSDTLRIAALFRAAPAATQARVLDMLRPEGPGKRKTRRICLIGLRGAGKSTLGAMLGQTLRVPFVELNRVIEENSGMPVNEVLALYGQEGYRKLEAQAVERVIADHDSVVLAVAGGIVSDPEAFRTLLTHFHTIWLRASPAEHMARVKAQGDTRPMAGNPEAMEQLRSILLSREALYAQADATLDTSGKTPEESHAALAELIRTKGFVDGA